MDGKSRKNIYLTDKITRKASCRRAILSYKNDMKLAVSRAKFFFRFFKVTSWWNVASARRLTSDSIILSQCDFESDKFATIWSNSTFGFAKGAISPVTPLAPPCVRLSGAWSRFIRDVPAGGRVRLGDEFAEMSRGSKWSSSTGRLDGRPLDETSERVLSNRYLKLQIDTNVFCRTTKCDILT